MQYQMHASLDQTIYKHPNIYQNVLIIKYIYQNVLIIKYIDNMNLFYLAAF